MLGVGWELRAFRNRCTSVATCASQMSTAMCSDVPSVSFCPHLQLILCAFQGNAWESDGAGPARLFSRWD